MIEHAVTDLPPDAGWLVVASAQHTRAILLARDGDRASEAALVYGDTLAQALWTQRLRTLQAATALKSYVRLRVEHEQVSRSAETDPLTGVANRRGFDRFVEAMAGQAIGDVGVLLPGADATRATVVPERMVERIDGIENCLVTGSVGVASGPAPQIRTTLREADSAMYVAKRAGGNRHFAT